MRLTTDRRAAAAIAVAALLGSAPAMAEDVTFDVAAELHGNYYWRGGYIWQSVPSLMPSVTASWKFLYLDVWAAVPFSDRDVLKPVRDEIDLTLGAAFDVGETAALDVGAIVYLYPNDMGSHTEEIFGVLSIDPADWGIDIGVYGDVNAYDGVYAHVTPRYTLGNDDLSLEASLTLSNGFYGGDYAFLEIAPGATLTVPFDQFELFAGGLVAFNPDAGEALWDAFIGIATSF